LIAHHCRRNRILEQRLFQKNKKALDAYPLKSLGKGNSTIVQPLPPLLCFVSAIVQDNNCDYTGNSLYKEWIWNCSLLGQYPNQGTYHWWFNQASTTTLLMCWQYTTSLSHLYIKEWRLEDLKLTHTILQEPYLCRNCFTSRFTYNFLTTFIS